MASSPSCTVHCLGLCTVALLLGELRLSTRALTRGELASSKLKVTLRLQSDSVTADVLNRGRLLEIRSWWVSTLN